MSFPGSRILVPVSNCSSRSFPPDLKGADHSTCHEVLHFTPVLGAGLLASFGCLEFLQNTERHTGRSCVRSLPHLIVRASFVQGGGERGSFTAFTLKDGALWLTDLFGASKDYPVATFFAYEDYALRRTSHVNSLLLQAASPVRC